MPLLYMFLSWAIGLPLLLLTDAYIRGRYDKSMFAVERLHSKSDEWDRGCSIFFWPIYFTCMAIKA